MTRRWWLVSLLGLLTINGEPRPGQATPDTVPSPPTSASDPRLKTIHQALDSWEARPGPKRAVVDQVCLVPDLPTYLDAIATWDRDHYFPVLFDDVESSFRFIRAFRPARIVRMPKSGKAIVAGKSWDRAVETVGASWTSEVTPSSTGLRGDFVPKTLGPTPPGLVISSSTAPMLAGAVALAAGHFQPLLRFESAKHFAEVLSLEDVEVFARSLDRIVGEKVPDHERLGDDCDFLTLAGDFPYRCRDAKGKPEALDDRIGRSAVDEARWAFVGRLLGDASESAYRAMCSLFLQPESALMFNGYDEFTSPWSFYSMRTASVRFSSTLPTSQVSGESQANLTGWHEAFDPSNRFGLILINSLGSPTQFQLRGGQAHAPDIPLGVPTAVLMIHSFSAANPHDPSTIAGRWLANGSYLYFGSMDEPYLDAFRTPRLVGDMITRRMPLVVAVRQTSGESRGLPWKLVFLGDPLYRIEPKPVTAQPTRLDHDELTAEWPSYAEGPRPDSGDDLDLFQWTWKTALARLQGAGRQLIPSSTDDLVEAVLAIRRDKLPAALRPVYDALSIEILLEARKRATLKGRLLALHEVDRSPAVRRTIETLATMDFQLSLAQEDVKKARATWFELMQTGATQGFKQTITTQVGQLAHSPGQVDEWRTLLHATLRDRSQPPDSEIIVAELKRIDEAPKAGQ